MIQEDDGIINLSSDEEVDTFPASTNGKFANGNDPGNTTFTEEEIKKANKPQPNVILSEVAGDVNGGLTYRDSERVASRANVAPDDNDTNTGGMSAGGAKGASQS